MSMGGLSFDFFSIVIHSFFRTVFFVRIIQSFGAQIFPVVWPQALFLLSKYGSKTVPTWNFPHGTCFSVALGSVICA